MLQIAKSKERADYPTNPLSLGVEAFVEPVEVASDQQRLALSRPGSFTATESPLQARTLRLHSFTVGLIQQRFG